MTQLRIIQTFVLIKCKNPISDCFDALLLFGYTRVCEVAVAESNPQPSVPNRNSSRLKH